MSDRLQHYRYFKVVTAATKELRITDTVGWHPDHVVLPGASVTENIAAALDDLLPAVKQYVPQQLTRRNRSQPPTR